MKRGGAWRYLWTAPDIRRKLLITLAILILYRFVSHIPVPGVNRDLISSLMNQGSAASTETTRVTAATRDRRHPSPGAAAHTNATAAASINPVGVKPASAIQNAKPHHEPRPRAQPQHCRGPPRQAAVADQQAPMALQQPLGDVRIPDGQRCGDELPTEAGLGQHGTNKPRRTPPRQHQPRHQQGFDHHAAVEDGRCHRDEEILRQRARRGFGQPERGVGQIGPRRRDGIAPQQVAGCQQRRGHQQRQCQRIRRQQNRAEPQCYRSGGRSDGRCAGNFSVLASAPGTWMPWVSKKPWSAVSSPGSIRVDSARMPNAPTTAPPISRASCARLRGRGSCGASRPTAPA